MDSPRYETALIVGAGEVVPVDGVTRAGEAEVRLWPGARDTRSRVAGVKSLLVDHSDRGRWLGALLNSAPDFSDPEHPVTDAPEAAAEKRTTRV